MPDSDQVSEGWSLVLEREGHQYWLFDEDREWEDARAMMRSLGRLPLLAKFHGRAPKPCGNLSLREVMTFATGLAIHQDFGTVECSDPNGGWSGARSGADEPFFLRAPGESLPMRNNKRKSVVQISSGTSRATTARMMPQVRHAMMETTALVDFHECIPERADDQGCTDACCVQLPTTRASLDDGRLRLLLQPPPGCCHAGTVWDVALQQCVVAEPAYLK